MLTDDNLNLIFNSETGYQSDLLIEDNDETYIVEILNVYDAYLPSYEELKDQVTKDYKNIKTNELLEAKVSDLELAYKYTDEENFVNFANQYKRFQFSSLVQDDNPIFAVGNKQHVHHALH